MKGASRGLPLRHHPNTLVEIPGNRRELRNGYLNTRLGFKYETATPSSGVNQTACCTKVWCSFRTVYVR